MAGIGFELNKLLKRNSFISDIVAIFYSANVSAGPWIMSSITLFLIQVLIPQTQVPFLISALIYTFIFSTIIFGAFSTSITRFLADLIYKNEIEKIYKLYISSLTYGISASSLFLICFFLINRITEFPKIFLFSYSMIILTIIWIQVIFITAVRKLLPIVISFLFGSLISFSLTIFLYNYRGEYFAYFGYNLGLMFITSILQFYIRRYLYMRINSKEKHLFLTAIKAYKKQSIAGILTYLAAWIDDFIAWAYFKYSVSKGFIFAPQYDIPMFISYLFIIPTMILFVMNLETDFYTTYRVFYKSIEDNKKLKYIAISKSSLDENVRSATRLIFSVQFVFMIIGLVLSKDLAKLLLLNDYGLRALRFGIVGASSNGIFLYISLLSYYFDLPDIPLRASIIAFVINFVVSIFTVAKFPGIGFLIGFTISVVFSWVLFSNIYSDLLHFEFARNKLILSKRGVTVYENKDEKIEKKEL